MENVVDFSVFDNIQSGDHCAGKKPAGCCKVLDRVITTLDYHQMTIVNPSAAAKYGAEPESAFTAFCDELYSKRNMVNDYIHFIKHHADPASIEYIKQRLHFECDSAVKCGATTRHYRDRRDDSNGGNGSKLKWFTDRMDSIHFMVHHLTELGLRVPAKAMESERASDDEEKDDSFLVDVALQRMGKEIESKRSAFSTERLGGATNSKFTLQIEDQKESGDGVGRHGLCSLHFAFWFGPHSALSLSVWAQTECTLNAPKQNRKCKGRQEGLCGAADLEATAG
jgi:hypothetical protein